MHHVFNVESISHEVNAQQAGVTVGAVKSLEALTQVPLRCQTSQAAAQILHVRGEIILPLLMLCTLESYGSLWCLF